MPNIRPERDADHEATRRLHTRIFPEPTEARIVDALRDAGAVYASLVSLEADRVVGHAVFSHAKLDFGSTALDIGALGPVAVLPDHQRQGIGGALIRAGLRHCWDLGLPAVVVLGDPNYYARFEFDRTDAWDIRCEYDVPPEAFMVTWAAEPKRGPAIAKYHSAFASAGTGGRGRD